MKQKNIKYFVLAGNFKHELRRSGFPLRRETFEYSQFLDLGPQSVLKKIILRWGLCSHKNM